MYVDVCDSLSAEQPRLPVGKIIEKIIQVSEKLFRFDEMEVNNYFEILLFITFSL